jgi:hypothetical protein
LGAYRIPQEAGPLIPSPSRAFRRAAYLAHPLPTGIGTFSSRIQSEALLQDGGELLFDPKIQVTHDLEGWSMEADVRRNAGPGTIATRLRDASLSWARLVRLGPVSIPVILTGKSVDSWWDCVRCGRYYSVRWFQLPAAMLVSIGIHLLELRGFGKPIRAEICENRSFDDTRSDADDSRSGVAPRWRMDLYGRFRESVASGAVSGADRLRAAGG